MKQGSANAIQRRLTGAFLLVGIIPLLALETARWLGGGYWLMLLLCALPMALLAYYLASRFARPIVRVNRTVEALIHHQDPPPLPVSRCPELGSLARNVNSMMTSRKQFEQRLRASEAAARSTLYELNERQRALDHHAIVGITDLRGDIVYINHKFEQISGFGAAELLGNNHRIINSGTHPKAFFRDMYRIICRGEVWHGDICNRAKNGSEYWVATTIVPLRNPAGDVDRFMSLRTDITEQKQAQERLRQALDAAEAGARAKSEFLATMSHEIRTPMNGVLGMLGLLTRTELNDDQRHQARLAMESAESLLVIINDILDFSKIEAGKLEIDDIDFDLPSMLGDFAEAMAMRAQAKHLELVLDLTGLTQSMVRGDPGRLRQILSNLVDNAIKFTEQGEIVIQARLVGAGTEYYRFQCQVSDTGMGIALDQQQRIFDSFTQADGSSTRRHGGTGLGLAVVKQLCRLMGGDISLDSTPGQGSCFHFHLKLWASQQPAPAPLPEADLAQIPILVVDDNSTNREVLQRQLSLWGAEVTTAGDAAGALQRIDARLAEGHEPPFAVAFLDRLMPTMNGIELGRRIRQNPRLDAMSLVMMTSISNRGDARELTAIGFDAYFPKPTTLGDLLRALQVLLAPRGTARERPLVTQHYLNSLPLPAPQQLPWPADCRLLLVEDNAINQHVIHSQLQAMGLPCETAAEGDAALTRLRQTDPDRPFSLILMDCQMPGRDGYATTQAIRNGEAGEHYRYIPVLALTANAIKGDRERCLQAGMNDYLSKPVKLEDLQQKLQLWLCGNHDPAPAAAAPKPRLAVWDSAAVHKRVRYKTERVQVLVEMFLEGAPEHLRQLQQAMADKDLRQAIYHAHTLKGMAGNLSAERLAAAAGALEQHLREPAGPVQAGPVQAGPEALLGAVDEQLLQLTGLLKDYLRGAAVTPR
ncbi:MAG: response regulator [Pseudomonadota bacterium]|nr:response regulator [Pseudomonadota bacterium]